MPVKLPPTTLLRSSLPVSRSHQMILNSTRHPSRAPPVFCRVFPFKLKYLGLGFSPPNSHLPRSFSTRPFRAKPDRNPREGEIRASKSLIEDEDELSDWVSGLRTSSYKSGVFTEDEEESEYGKGKKRGRDGVRVRGLGELGEDGGGSRRRGEREFSGGGGDEMGQMERPGSRKLSNLGKKSSGFGRRFEEEDDGGQGFSRTKGPIRGGIRRGDRAFGVRNSRRFGNESEEEEDEDDSGWTLGRKKGGVRQGSKRGEKGFEAKDRWVRGDRRVGSVKNGGVGRVAFGSQNENSDFARRGEKSVSSFMDLMGDEDSEEGISGDEDDDEDEDEIKSRSALFPKKVARQSSPPSSPSRSGSYLSETRFDQCAISPLTLKAIKDVGYENMTVVQEATLPVILKGKDVMAKAKTGTGKTVAFLLPSIEVAVKSPPASRDQKRPPILVLVICPTRELASQAAAEASSLLKYHPTLGVQVVMGGTRLAVEQKRMQANPCQILVATPGRLRDHLENTAGFATRLMGVKVLVLDEADHLLDMGFRKDIERIIAAVPKQRQTLMFSATIPEEVRQVCHIALKRDHEFIDTVEEGSEETHSQVRQMHLVAPLDKHFSLLYAILKEHISDDVNYKVLVFCTTAMVTRLVADLLGELNLNVREIHSRKAQSYRTKVSDEFRKSKGLILVTSDVSARGVDYPDVTLVIQLGLPSDREQYIHRLGRTGRKGKEGVGILMLAPWEEFFLLSIKDLPISKSPMPMVDPDLRKKVERALAHVEMKNKETAYQAWLGYYNSNKIIARDKLRLVELANEFSRSMGLDNPPAIPKLVLGKMGLKNVPGLRSK